MENEKEQLEITNKQSREDLEQAEQLSTTLQNKLTEANMARINLEDENRQLRGDLQEMSSVGIASRNETIRLLEEANTALQEEHKHLAAKLSTATERIAYLENGLEFERASRNDLDASTRVTIALLEQRLNEQQALLEKSKKDCDNLESVSVYYLLLLLLLFIIYYLLFITFVSLFVSLFVLFCFVLFCFVLFCFVLFCFVLFCFVLFCFVFLSVRLSWLNWGLSPNTEGERRVRRTNQKTQSIPASLPDSPSIIHHSSSIIHHPSFIIHHSSSIIHHSSSIIQHPFIEWVGCPILHFPFSMSSKFIHHQVFVHNKDIYPCPATIKIGKDEPNQQIYSH